MILQVSFSPVCTCPFPANVALLICCYLYKQSARLLPTHTQDAAALARAPQVVVMLRRELSMEEAQTLWEMQARLACRI